MFILLSDICCKRLRLTMDNLFASVVRPTNKSASLLINTKENLHLVPMHNSQRDIPFAKYIDVGSFEVLIRQPIEFEHLSTCPYSAHHHDSWQIQQLPFYQNKLYLICADHQASVLTITRTELSMFINGSRIDRLGMLFFEQSCSIDS